MGIVTDRLKHRGIDHAQPPISIQLLVDLGKMLRAEIDLEARLGVAEIVRAETRFGAGTEQRRKNVVEQRLEIAHRDIAVNVETLKLVEVGRVRGVGRVAAETAAGETMRKGGGC